MSTTTPSEHIQQVTGPSTKTAPQDDRDNAAPGYPTPPSTPQDTQWISKRPRQLEDNAGLGAETGVQPHTNTSESTLELSPQAQKPDATDAPISLQTLRIRLGLQSWQCGGMKLDNSPCKLTISVSKRTLINSRLQSMIAHVKTSEDLQIRLEGLITLVHCRWHIHGPTKVSRIAVWKACFASLCNITLSTQSIGDKIKMIWDNFSIKCKAFTSGSKQCTEGIGGWRVTNCEKTINEIIKPEVYLDDARLDYYLEVLESNMYCPAHLKSPFIQVAMWKSTIQEICNGAQPGSSEAEDSNNLELLNNAKIGKEAFTKMEKPPTSLRQNYEVVSACSVKTLGLSPEFAKDPVEFWPITKNTSRFDLIPWNKKPGGATGPHIIREVLVKSFSDKEHQDGYVYAFEVEGNKGFVKIGYTTRTVKDRLKDWEFDCNRVPKCLYPNPSNNVMKVPNAHRVEQLCHAEFSSYRVRTYCKVCRKQHLEWFEISSKEAIAVIRKWTRWMRRDPYEEIQQRSKVKWDLKDQEIQKTNDMLRFMQDLL
ncbi:T5orf172 domain-containing protein [Aspergillus cavernicola]|uniref:T5orf172 domain-containing protein n=1 Tax=Aspergillus cavernicola TaxID=176166 RepID=A0ABR4I702_9EURO